AGLIVGYSASRNPLPLVSKRGAMRQRAPMASTLLRWWLVVVCYLVLGSSSAYADDALAPPTNAKAREHFVRGNRLYRIREFAKAVDEYKAGSLAQPVTVFLYNLGQCHRQLGKHKEALWYYEMFLKRGNPTGELRQY